MTPRPGAGLTPEDRARYHRQIIIPDWGEPGQARLKAARAFIAGAGGLGSPASIYLAVAGVGRLAICDSDRAELSNLNRQVLHNDSRLGLSKAESARLTLSELNPSIAVEALAAHIEPDNVDDLVADADIILDCLDNFPTRYLLNQCALRKGIPLVHGSVRGLEGRLTFLHPPETPCLRCLFPVPPPAEVFPVLGATPGVIGCLQAMEALKYLTGVGTPLKGALLAWDGADMEFVTCPVSRRPDCSDCSGQR